FGLLDPVVQRLRGAADLRRNRHDRLPARRVLTLVVENQPHRALAHFRGKLVRRLAHDAPSYSGVGASGKPGAVQTPVYGHTTVNVFGNTAYGQTSLYGGQPILQPYSSTSLVVVMFTAPNIPPNAIDARTIVA